MFLRNCRRKTGSKWPRQTPFKQLSLWNASVFYPSTKVTSVSPSARLVYDSRRTTHTSTKKNNFYSLLNEQDLSGDIPAATHRIASIGKSHVGEEVVLHGYLGPRADLSKSISFVPLRSPDLGHSIQVVSTAGSEDPAIERSHSKLKDQTQHSPVALRGVVQNRKKPKEHQSPQNVSRNEDVEIHLLALHVFNKFPSNITFQEDTVFPLEQRHLQIRQNGALRRALSFRSRIALCCRNYLDNQGFTEVETPLLFKSTPEGAREFLVPTRKRGHAYALPQSPQQYKQILMASGIPKYFQLAKCFRDEDLRADRQPEFTQLDMEMAFSSSADVISNVENLIRHVWEEVMEDSLPSTPFKVVSYDDAMSRYGSDKPDIRLGMEIMRIGHMIPADLVSKIGPLSDPIVEAFKLNVSEEATVSRTFITEFMDSADGAPFLQNPHGQPGIFIFDPRKPMAGLQAFGFQAAEDMEEVLELEEGDIVIIQARQNSPYAGGATMLGNLRTALHHSAVSKGHLAPPSGWNFVWINDFPLFAPADGEEPGREGKDGLTSTHHPFTAPASLEDLHLLATNPLEAKADHYDLVLNGVELGGGSRRIHNAQLQEFVLRDVLNMSDDAMNNFDHLLEALNAGCPPHAGIAIGFDRLVAVMLEAESIREVIAFPKSGRGEDALVKSPSRITKQQLETYHLTPSE